MNLKKPDQFFARILPQKLAAWHQKKPLLFYLGAGFVCYTVAFYCLMLMPQYPGSPRVAGAFYLGMILGTNWILFPVLTLIIWPLKYLGYTYAYAAMLILSMTLAAAGLQKNKPEQYIRDRIFRFQKMESFEVNQLRLSDSFGDGRQAAGQITAPPETIQSLRSCRQLKETVNDLGQTVLKDDWLTVIPESGNRYSFEWRELRPERK